MGGGEGEGSSASSARPDNTLTIETVNPSRWGSVVRQHITRSSADIISIAETHREGDDLLRCEAIKEPHRVHFWSPADPSGKHQTTQGKRWANHGGVAQFAHRSTGATSLGGLKGSDGWDPSAGIGNGWLALLVGTQRLASAVVYMDDSIGFTGDNVRKFNEIIAFVRSTRRFLILYGDFNMSPQQLYDGADLGYLDLEIVVPSDSSFTCLQGRGTLSTLFRHQQAAPPPREELQHFHGSVGNPPRRPPLHAV